jgi:hypothetical protein
MKIDAPVYTESELDAAVDEFMNRLYAVEAPLDEVVDEILPSVAAYLMMGAACELYGTNAMGSTYVVEGWRQVLNETKIRWPDVTAPAIMFPYEPNEWWE